MKALVSEFHIDHDHDRASSTEDASPVARKIHRKAGAGPSVGQSIEPAAASSGFFEALNAGLVMRNGNDAVHDQASTLVSRASEGSSQGLPDQLRGQFEQSLGADLSGVRVHTGAAANEASTALGARAYAVGQDVFMGAGQYAPDTADGAWLLAHEVAHTVQQRGGSQGPQTKLEISEPGDAMEHEADRAADAMMSRTPISIGGAPQTLARQVDPATAARSSASRGQALSQVATIVDLAALRAVHDRLTAASRGNPDEMVVAEVNGSYPMTRRDLWAVVQAVDDRQRQLDSSMQLSPAQGPRSHDGPASFPTGGAEGVAQTRGRVEVPENPVAEGLERAGHGAHLVETGAEAVNLLRVGGGALAHGAGGAFSHAVGGALTHMAADLPFTVATAVLFGTLIFASTQTAYSEYEFPATVDHQFGGAMTQNARAFSSAVTSVLRGGTASGPQAAQATAIANQQLAMMQARNPSMPRAQVLANLREQPNLEQQVFNALVPAFRAASDARAASLVRENHRPAEELTILAGNLRGRVEAARP